MKPTWRENERGKSLRETRFLLKVKASSEAGTATVTRTHELSGRDVSDCKRGMDRIPRTRSGHKTSWMMSFITSLVLRRPSERRAFIFEYRAAAESVGVRRRVPVACPTFRPNVPNALDDDKVIAFSKLKLFAKMHKGFIHPFLFRSRGSQACTDTFLA